MKPWEKLHNINICVSGDNNIIEIEYPIFVSLKMDIDVSSSESVIFIKKNCQVHKAKFIIARGHNQKLSIGENTLIVGLEVGLNEPNSEAYIGDNCIISYDVRFMIGDMHSVISVDNDKVINTVKRPFVINNNVWVGMGTIFTKNAHIPANPVIGAGSVVSGKYEEDNTVIAGNPAKVVKKGVY